MTNIRRTYPQPDSNLSHLTPNERALAILKYVGEQEPEIVRTEEGKALHASLVELFADRVTGPRELAAIAISRTLKHPEPLSHTLLPLVEHAFVQHRRRIAGQPLQPSLVEMRRS